MAWWVASLAHQREAILQRLTLHRENRSDPIPTLTEQQLLGVIEAHVLGCFARTVSRFGNRLHRRADHALLDGLVQYTRFLEVAHQVQGQGIVIARGPVRRWIEVGLKFARVRENPFH